MEEVITVEEIFKTSKNNSLKYTRVITRVVHEVNGQTVLEGGNSRSWAAGILVRY